MRLRGWVSLLVGCFALTSLAGASVDIQNIGYDASFGILLEGNVVAFRSLETRSGNMDLNGDGDAVDGVLLVLDAATGVLTNTGYDASGGMDLGGGVVGFRVIENRQGNQDLNGDGDTLDIVQFVYDAATGSVTNLGLASLSFDVGDGLAAFVVSESGQGGTDLNSDGDSTDFVLHVYDPSSGTLTNVGLDGGNGFVVGAEGVVFAVSEARQGNSDLNGDADKLDDVLHFFNASTGVTHNLGRAVSSGKFSVEDGLVAFLVREAAQGATDYNGDGDSVDDVLQVFDVASGTLVNSGYASSSFVVAEGLVAFAVVEAAEGADANGDGDVGDTVLHLYDGGTASTQNLGVAVSGFELDGHHLAFAVDESDEGLTDFNGDGDTSDVVLHLRDLATASTINLATDASLGFKLDDDTLLAFGAHESAQGTDLNGDGDLNDFVLHVFDIAAGSLNNLAVDPSGGFQTFQLDSTYVSLGVQEQAQGMTDLNGDGDAFDIVLHLFDASTGTTENLGLDVGVGHAVDDGRIVFGVTESRQGMTDLNGDGDTGDVILHVATVEPDVLMTPEQRIEALMGDLVSLGLPPGTEHSRMVALEQALARLEAGDACGAAHSLGTFVHMVEAQAGKKIDASDAEQLVADAEAVIAMLDGECDGGGREARGSRFRGSGRVAGSGQDNCPAFGYHRSRNHRNHNHEKSKGWHRS